MVSISPFSLFFPIELVSSQHAEAFRMPSKLIERYKKTAPMCYKRLSNSVAGSAQACVGISNELNDIGMQVSCMIQPSTCSEPNFSPCTTH